MRVSFIIPTLNEELWLPGALACIRGFADDMEIIVADNHSNDGTVGIALADDCRVVEGGLPAVARNAGARVATGDILVFMDADVKPTHEALRAGIERLRLGNVGVFYRYAPDTRSPLVELAYGAAHRYFITLRAFGIVRGMGPLIIANSEAFALSGGFPEDIAAAEDVEFVRLLARVGPVAYETGHGVTISARRFQAENPLAFMLKCILWGILRGFGIQRSLIRYKWHSYKPEHRNEASGW